MLFISNKYSQSILSMKRVLFPLIRGMATLAIYINRPLVNSLLRSRSIVLVASCEPPRVNSQEVLHGRRSQYYPFSFQ